ncbi:MAG: ABC transporter permease [Muribaculaceae bacterium]|nr:ABC transporter permease [Muribaculaceae bacterium]
MIRFLLEKEFKQIFRNKFIPKMLIMMPLMIMFVLPWAANQEVKDIRLGVVNYDNREISNRLIDKITSSDYFILVDDYLSAREANDAVERGDIDMILEIPNNFEKEMIRSHNVKVMIATNSVNGTKGVLGTSYLSSIINDYSNDITINHGIIAGKSNINLSVKYLFNVLMDYKVFMIPALIVMLLTMLSGFLPALNIVSEKEVGTIEQINVSPINRLTFVLSKLIPYWVIGIVIMSVCLIVAALVYNLLPAGNVFTIYLFSILYILVVSGLGIVLSNYSDTMQQAMFVMFFFVMILMLMSGLYTPISGMPDWARYITIVNPLKYYIEVMRSVYLKGSTFFDLIPQFYALVVFALFFNCWAVISYKKRN